MSITMEEVRAVLDPEEPDYAQAARLGPDAVPHLETLVRGTDRMIASKATYAASLINDSRAVSVINTATRSNFPEVRVAAAAGARNLATPLAADVLLALIDDHDFG